MSAECSHMTWLARRGSGLSSQAIHPHGATNTHAHTHTQTKVLALMPRTRTDPGARLLLVAPSNTAADMLAERLLSTGVPKSQLLRVCACAFSAAGCGVRMFVYDIVAVAAQAGQCTLWL